MEIIYHMRKTDHFEKVFIFLKAFSDLLRKKGGIWQEMIAKSDNIVHMNRTVRFWDDIIMPVTNSPQNTVIKGCGLKG